MNRKLLLEKSMQHGLSVGELALILKVHKSTMYRRLAGKYCFKIGEIEKLRYILSLSETDILNIFFD